MARLDSIVEGLDFLLAHYKEWGITSIAIPPLGCGEGQLEWRIVGPTLYRYFSKMDIPVELYAHTTPLTEELQPQFLSGHEVYKNTIPDPKWIPAGWVILVEIIKRLEDEPYKQHSSIGKTIFQKIAYVASKAGVDTKLDFQQASYGPYSADSKKMYYQDLLIMVYSLKHIWGKCMPLNLVQLMKMLERLMQMKSKQRMISSKKLLISLFDSIQSKLKLLPL